MKEFSLRWGTIPLAREVSRGKGTWTRRYPITLALNVFMIQYGKGSLDDMSKQSMRVFVIHVTNVITKERENPI